MVTVTAMRRFYYGGRDVSVGDLVKMSPLDAAVHGRKRNVSLSKPVTPVRPTYQTAAMQPEPPAEDVPVRTRRVYRRRDLVAEPLTVTPEPTPESGE